MKKGQCEIRKMITISFLTMLFFCVSNGHTIKTGYSSISPDHARAQLLNNGDTDASGDDVMDTLCMSPISGHRLPIGIPCTNHSTNDICGTWRCNGKGLCVKDTTMFDEILKPKALRIMPDSLSIVFLCSSAFTFLVSLWILLMRRLWPQKLKRESR